MERIPWNSFHMVSLKNPNIPETDSKRAPSAESMNKSLIIIPIVHTLEDLGSQKDLAVRASLRMGGRRALERKTQAIKDLWTRIEHFVESLELPWEKVRVYQDALPVSGREQEIVTELARGGSLNHHLILRLSERGATIMGTESPGLLLAEYEAAKKALESGGRRVAASPRKAQADPILTRRDRFIANRINRTLQPGETGILFLGMLHSVDPYLDKDIEIRRPSLAKEYRS